MDIKPFFGMSKIGYLQVLANTYGDFKIAKGELAEDGSIRWTKHHSVMECWQNGWWMALEQANNRSGLDAEIRIDIDAGDHPETARARFDAACDKLEGYLVPYLGFTSGSRGFHIHLFDANLLRDRYPIYTKEAVIKDLGGELVKAHNSPMLTLEFAANNKTGNLKEPIRGSLRWLDGDK